MGSQADARIFFYTRAEAQYNFGDYLSDYIHSKFLIAPFAHADVYRIIGSVISEEIILSDLKGRDELARVAFWCCGARGGGALSSDAKSRSDFFGVRGPLTRSVLGLPADTPLGDPGFLMPLAYHPRLKPELVGKVACMPHFSALGREKALLKESGADVVLSPAVGSHEELEDLFDQIASVSFLLTASLHGAIIAAAYRVPFAFWSYGEIDVPFKWEDLSALLGIEPVFHSSVASGQTWWDAQAGRLDLPKLVPMLACCPFGVQPKIWSNALRADGGLLFDEHYASVGFDHHEWRSHVQMRNDEHLRRQHEVALGAFRQARNDAAKDMDSLVQSLEHLSQSARARRSALQHNFRTDPQIAFAAGEAGNAMLGAGWTAANEVAPWSLPPISEIVLPAGSGWEMAHSIQMEGYLFAPRNGEDGGRRKFSVWLNETHSYTDVFINQGDGDTILVGFSVEIPEHARAQRSLSIRVATDSIVSPMQLGIGDDDRPIGFAPLRLTVTQKAL